MNTETDVLKVLIVSSCSGEKKFSVSNPAVMPELDNLELRIQKELALKDYKVKAREMFISNQNKFINEGINAIFSKKLKFDLFFISSGYGYISAEDEVIPYDVNFSVMTVHDLEKRSETLRIHEEVYYSAKKYDLIIFLLGYEYIKVLRPPLELDENIKQIFLISHSDEKVLTDIPNIFKIQTGNDEANRLKVKPSDLKGYIVRLLCKTEAEKTFLEIYKNPYYINEIIKFKEVKKDFSNEQLSLFDI